jgi:hypothetical protein
VKVTASQQERLKAYGGLEGLLDAAENTRQHRANGRILGQEMNKLRSIRAREKWGVMAAKWESNRRGETLDQLAILIYQRSREDGIKMSNGKHYALRTIQNFIKLLPIKEI